MQHTNTKAQRHASCRIGYEEKRKVINCTFIRQHQQRHARHARIRHGAAGLPARTRGFPPPSKRKRGCVHACMHAWAAGFESGPGTLPRHQGLAPLPAPIPLPLVPNPPPLPHTPYRPAQCRSGGRSSHQAQARAPPPLPVRSAGGRCGACCRRGQAQAVHASPCAAAPPQACTARQQASQGQGVLAAPPPQVHMPMHMRPGWLQSRPGLAHPYM